MATPAGQSALVDNGNQEGDSIYSRETHTHMSYCPTPSRHLPPTPTSTTNTWQTAIKHEIISRSFLTASKQHQQDRIRSSVLNELMTKTSSLPPQPLLTPCNASYPQPTTMHRRILSNGPSSNVKGGMKQVTQNVHHVYHLPHLSPWKLPRIPCKLLPWSLCGGLR